jgi:hypothetical protein
MREDRSDLAVTIAGVTVLTIVLIFLAAVL